MDITVLPKTRKIGNCDCSLNAFYDTPGWCVTYMYYDYDPLEMDFYPSLSEAVEALAKRIEFTPDEITKEWLESHGYREETPYGYSEWVSEDKKIVISKFSNTPDRPWSVHVDNQDFQGIGGLDIRYVWQLEEFLRLCEVG